MASTPSSSPAAWGKNISAITTLFTSKGIINFSAPLCVKLCLHFEHPVPPSTDHLLPIRTPVNREDLISVSRKVKVQLLLLQVPHLGSKEREGGRERGRVSE